MIGRKQLHTSNTGNRKRFHGCKVQLKYRHESQQSVGEPEVRPIESPVSRKSLFDCITLTFALWVHCAYLPRLCMWLIVVCQWYSTVVLLCCGFVAFCCNAVAYKKLRKVVIVWLKSIPNICSRATCCTIVKMLFWRVILWLIYCIGTSLPYCFCEGINNADYILLKTEEKT